MLQDTRGEASHRPVAHPGEDHVAQLVEEGGAELQGPVGQQERARQDEGIERDPFEGVHDLLEDQRDTHVGQLRQHQTTDRQGGASPKLPQIGEHRPQVMPVTAITVGALGGGDTLHQGPVALGRGGCHLAGLETGSITTRKFGGDEAG